MKALTNLLKQRIPSCFSKREMRKFYIVPTSFPSFSFKTFDVYLANKYFSQKKKTLAKALPFYEENQAPL